MSCRPLRSDRGAMAIMIALSVLVMAGIAVLVIDVGSLYEERRDLQNGADAAALALAQSCATDEPGFTCTGGPNATETALAELYADANASDAAARVFDVIFDGREVTVEIRTEDASGDPESVDPWFSRIWGHSGTEVFATASAAWGSPTTVSAIPIVISSCEWSIATGDGDEYGAEHYRIIYLHDLNEKGMKAVGANGSTPPLCKSGPGQDVDLPGPEDDDVDRAEGGFGYLDSHDCRSTVSVGGFVLGQPGASNPGSLGCDPGDLLDQTLLVPIFDDIAFSGTPCGGPPGQNCYHIYGFSLFHVLDIDLTGGGWSNQGNICRPQQRCLGGYFASGFIPLQAGLEMLGDADPPDLGVSVVVLSS